MANNILYISDGDYGATPSGYILPLVQGQFGQSIPLEIRDLAENVVNLTGYSTITGHKRKGSSVTAWVGTIVLNGTPSAAPQIILTVSESDTGDYGNFALFLEISNGTISYTTHPVGLSIVRDPAVNATVAPGLVGVTTAQKTLLASFAELTGLIKMASGSATGVAIQSFMQTFLTSATVIAARINLLPSYSSNGTKVLAVNAGETDIEYKLVDTDFVADASEWAGDTLSATLNAIDDQKQSKIVGEVKMYAGSSAPAGWLLCDGSAISRTTYAGLFSVLSTTYGAGNGSTTFNLPDLRGRTPIGVGQGSGLTNRVLGASGGSETHTLLETELPAHNHSLNATVNEGNEPSGMPGTNQILATVAMAVTSIYSDQPIDTSLRDASIGDSGGGASHNNMPPFLTMNFIIKT